MSKTDKKEAGEVPAAQALAVAALVDYGPGAVVSRTLSKGSAGTLTVFAFDEGQGLSEHSAPFDAYVQVLEGSVLLTIGGQKVAAKPGELVLMPANVPHGLHAGTKMKMLLTMLKHDAGKA
ncbi:MAG: cupin domain-containing protein [Deltaproteobacteria bacterium]|nr:cupin domain-containing protein [Deltaproteobacteria bacterium]